jgi:hypothetical protein
LVGVLDNHLAKHVEHKRTTRYTSYENFFFFPFNKTLPNKVKSLKSLAIQSSGLQIRSSVMFVIPTK